MPGSWDLVVYQGNTLMSLEIGSLFGVKEIHKEASWFLSVLSQTLKNNVNSLVHIAVPCGRCKLIFFLSFTYSLLSSTFWGGWEGVINSYT